MTLTQITEKGIKDGEILNADINASAAIAGSKIDPSFTGNITVSNTSPQIQLIDTDNNSDFQIKNNDGQFRIRDLTHSINRLTIASDGTVDVTGDMTIDTNTLHVDSSNNRVGIGTTSPSNMLHLSGTDPIIQFTDTAGGDSFGLFASHTNYLGFYNFTDSRVDMVIDGSGNVGIGTTSPDHPLDVEVSSGDAVTRIHAAENNNASEARLRLEVSNDFAESVVEAYDSSGIGGSLKYNHGDNAWRFTTNGDLERMRIDSSGNIGIGTASPSQPLHVEESTVNKGLLAYNTNTTSNASVPLFLASESGGSTTNVSIENAGAGDLAIRTGATTKDGYGSERMRIDSSGNVGIGTANPNYELQVNDPSGTVSVLQLTNTTTGTAAGDGLLMYITGNDTIISNEEAGYMRFQTSGLERMRIDSAGRLFVGTTTTSLGNSGVIGEFCLRGGTEGAAIHMADNNANVHAGFFTSNNSNFFVIRTITNHPMAFRTNNTERMRIHSTGVVQIMSERMTMGTSVTNGGTSDGNFAIDFAGNSRNAIKTRDTDNTGTVNHFVLVSGSAACGTITTSTGQAFFNNLSDYRSKENDVKITDGIEKIKLLRPIRFNYKVDKDTLCDGFFAHEVTAAVPTAVNGEKDAVDSEGEINPQMLDTGKIIPLLTAALQEAITKIETLETEVAALKAA